MILISIEEKTERKDYMPRKNLKHKKSQMLILFLVGIVLLGFLGGIFYGNIFNQSKASDDELNFSALMKNNGKYTLVFIYTDPTEDHV